MCPIFDSQRVTADSTSQPYGLCEFGHQGLYHDEETGIIYNRARYVHPLFGTFMQTDSLQYQDGMNLQEYLQSNPINLLDSMGLGQDLDEVFWIILPSTGRPHGISRYRLTRGRLTEEEVEVLRRPEIRAAAEKFAGMYFPNDPPLTLTEEDRRLYARIEGGINMVFAAMETVGGLAMMGLGGGSEVGSLGSSTVASVPAFVAGTAMTVNGCDNFQTGWRQLWTGDPQKTLLYQGVKYGTGSDTAAAIIDTGARVTGGTAGSIKLGQLASVRAAGTLASGKPQGLVHLTDPAHAAQIEATQLLKGDIYAGPLSNAGRTGWGVTWRTGMRPGTYQAITIPEGALGAFRKPVPVGIFTGWQRAMGTQYTARGVLDLSTGAFTRTGINWTQMGWYGIDVGADAVVVGGTLYLIDGGQGGGQ